MRSSLVFSVAFCAALLALTASCGSSGSNAGDGNNTNTASCEGDPNIMNYSAGMKVTGSSKIFTFVLVSANPAPPGVNFNTWTMQVLDSSGSAVTGATITVQPFMPTMGHGSSQVPQVTAQGNSYSITDIDLFMPGEWSMAVQATANNQSDVGTFFFCVN